MTIFFILQLFVIYKRCAFRTKKNKNEETRTPIDETRSDDDDDDVDERTRPDQNDPSYEHDSLFACLLACFAFCISLVSPLGIDFTCLFFYLLLAM